MAVDPLGEIITFYSYKGGTGRSMALANVACLLAQQAEGKGVLMVDWDLEAPGLHRFFRKRFTRYLSNADYPDAVFDEHPGLIDLFWEVEAATRSTSFAASISTEEAAHKLLHSINLERFVLATDIPSLSLLKAGRFDGKYASHVNSFAWEDFYKRSPGLIRAFARQLARQYQYVLIDSRTGLTDISGICTMLMPDKLVAVFTPNRQSLNGMMELIRRATSYRKQSDDLRPLVVFPLASRVEATMPKLIEDWRLGNPQKEIDGYQPQFEQLFKEVYDFPNCNLDKYFDEVQIQYVPDYAFGEEIAVLVERSMGRFSLTRSYITFTERLVKLVGPWEDVENITAGVRLEPELLTGVDQRHEESSNSIESAIEANSARLRRTILMTAILTATISIGLIIGAIMIFRPNIIWESTPSVTPTLTPSVTITSTNTLTATNAPTSTSTVTLTPTNPVSAQ